VGEGNGGVWCVIGWRLRRGFGGGDADGRDV